MWRSRVPPKPFTIESPFILENYNSTFLQHSLQSANSCYTSTTYHISYGISYSVNLALNHSIQQNHLQILGH